MSQPVIALATCAELPALDPEDAALLPALAERGIDARAAVWDDPEVDWSAFDLVVVRSVWDYAPRRAEFLRWAQGVPRLANPAAVLAWNTDKHYLQQLGDAGVRVVPTTWLEPERNFDPRALHNRFPAREDFVIKPAVSAGSLDTGRYTATDAGSRGLAIRHAYRLLQAGRSVMVQRYLTSVDTSGESALVFLGGEFSHAVHKGAMLDGPDVAIEGLYREERMSSYTASDEELEVARHVLATASTLVPGLADAPPLYARVDLVAGEDGPVLMELELTEPSLFFSLAEGSVGRCADAIARHLG